MAEQDKQATPPSEDKETDAKSESKAGGKKAKRNAQGDAKHVTAIDKYFAAAILFGIFVTIVSGFGAGISFYEVFYRCIVISILLWVISFAVRKYCRLLISFEGILKEMKKDSAVTSCDE